MKRTKMIILSFSLLAGLFMTTDAFSGTTFRVRVRPTPLKFRVGIRPVSRCRVVYNHHWQQEARVIGLTAFDRRVAKRLSRHEEINPRRLLEYRSRGLSWQQIGRRLGYSRHEVRVAMRWARRQMTKKPPHWCGTVTH